MAPGQEFGVTIEPGADAVVVRIRGDLDMSTTDALTDALTEAAAGGDVLAELTDVTFMDSSALSAIVSSARKVAAAGGRLTLGQRSSVVDRVLEITGLADGTDDFDVQPPTQGEGSGG
jgi:anti-sigma B factor antagonist